jgi:hypothetical protein
MYYSNIRILIFLKIQPCPFESFKKILYGFIRSVFCVVIEPLYYAFTLKV